MTIHPRRLHLKLPTPPDMPAIAREFAEIRPYGGARLIMADPPWRFEDWSPRGDKRKTVEAQYGTQHIDWIRALPVRALAAPDCLLWLWATNPMIPHALSVVEAWGFTFSTMGHWNKRTASGKLAFGGGRRLRSSSEPFIIATLGNPRVHNRSIRSVIEEGEEPCPVIDGVRREHSRKPEEAYAAAEAMSPDQARVDLFARQRRDGWVPWGNEIEKFSQEKSA